MINRKTCAALFLVVAALWPGLAAAQTSPNLIFGQVLTPAQWNQLFINKQDTLGYLPVNKSGDVMLGRLVTAAPSSTTAGLNLTCGSTPASPVNGDQWCTTAGLFMRINGVTIGPLSGPSSGSFAGTSPITVTFPAGVVTYAFDFTVANTFLAQQTSQGATTTQPGWYAQVAGDTVARVRLGPNSVDVAALSFGPGNAARDTHLERAGPAAFRLGSADAAAPIAQTLSIQNVVAGTSNTAGVDLTITGSRGTGTGAGGAIVFRTAPIGSTGSTQNALATVLTLDTNRAATFTGAMTITGPAVVIGSSLAVSGKSLTLADAAANSVMAIGQDSTHYITLNWAFNATPASASAQIATAGFSNPLTVDASNVSIQGISGGTLSLLGRTVALGGNLSTAGALTHAGAFATTITATATTNSTLPAGTHTLAGLDVAQTFSANQSFNSGNLLLNGSGSGASTLNAPATGGGTATLFAGTDTVVGVAAVQTLTGKSLVASSDIIGGVSMSLGADGTGDIYYRNAGGILTRLGIGSSTNLLTVSGGLPAWAAAPSTAITVGSTVVSGGTTTRILFDNAGVVGEYTLTGTGTTVAMSAGPTFTGTVTAPLLAGGAAAGSSLVLESTSGAGTTDFIAFQTASQSEKARILSNGNFGIGTNNSQNLLHVNNNTVQNIPKLIPGIQVSIADTSTGGIQIDTYGANPQITMRDANGTAASKTAVGNGTFLFILDAEGYDGSAYAGSGLWATQAAENWTGSAHGTYSSLQTTPIGSTARAEAARVQASGGFSVGNSSDGGIGNILSSTHTTSAPVTLTGTSGTVTAIQSSIIFNPSGTFTVTLPAAATFPGRWLWLKTIAAQIVNSASSNIVPVGSATAGTAILTATAGKWAALQSDGTNWVTMFSN